MKENPKTEFIPITILDVAKARLKLPADYDGELNGQQFYDVGLDILGGCECCGASIAAYNAYPSRSGYWRCASCIGPYGYASVAEFESFFPSNTDFDTLEQQTRKEEL